MKMEQTECSKTSAFKVQTPGNYPEEIIQHLSVCGHTDFVSTLEADVSCSVPAQDYMWHVSRFPTNKATLVTESLYQCVSKHSLPEAEHFIQQSRTHMFNGLFVVHPIICLYRNNNSNSGANFYV